MKNTIAFIIDDTQAPASASSLPKISMASTYAGTKLLLTAKSLVCQFKVKISTNSVVC